MTTKFRICPHHLLAGGEVVEVFKGKVFVAAIYPHQDGIRVISKYMTEVVKEEEPVYHSGQWIPAAIVKLEVG